jgi:hypothetical protein
MPSSTSAQGAHRTTHNKVGPAQRDSILKPARAAEGGRIGASVDVKKAVDDRTTAT